MTRRVAILQARMRSTRLPGKVLADVGGAPLLVRELERLERATRLDDIVIATSTNSADDPIAELAALRGTRCYRGEEGDVLARYVGAARESRADVVIRVTADCPLIDPDTVDRVTDTLLASPGGADYASNVIRRTYPRGLDAEAFHADVLERTARLATSPESREHVTWFVYRERPDLWSLRSVEDTADNSDLQWTVDTAADLARVRRIYVDLGLATNRLDHRQLVAGARSLAAGSRSGRD